jgi:hypothetical protein
MLKYTMTSADMALPMEALSTFAIRLRPKNTITAKPAEG